MKSSKKRTPTKKKKAPKKLTTKQQEQIKQKRGIVKAYVSKYVKDNDLLGRIIK